MFIRNALTQASPTQPTGNLARHLNTLAALISGIVGSKSTQLPTIAAKVGYPPKPGHFVSSITYRQGLMALPGQGQCIDLR